jgi:hypothetical protein
VEIKDGGGRWIIDQTLWPTRIENAKASRYISTLLTNLGVELHGQLPIKDELSRDGWKATASSLGAEAGIDGDEATRWSSGTAQAPGQFYQADMGKTHHVHAVVWDTGGSPGDYPRGYKVEVSLDGQNWKIAAEGEPKDFADNGVLEITFDPVEARFVKVTQTAAGGSSGGLWLSLHELRILGSEAR